MPKYDLSPAPTLTLPKPPAQYDQQYMFRLIAALQGKLRELDQPRYMLIGGGAQTFDMPTSSAGLRTGEIYNDSGTLKVVP